MSSSMLSRNIARTIFTILALYALWDSYAPYKRKQHLRRQVAYKILLTYTAPWSQTIISSFSLSCYLACQSQFQLSTYYSRLSQYLSIISLYSSFPQSGNLSLLWAISQKKLFQGTFTIAHFQFWCLSDSIYLPTQPLREWDLRLKSAPLPSRWSLLPI